MSSTPWTWPRIRATSVISAAAELLEILLALLDVFCFPPTPQVSYKKDAKASLHYTTIADRPDIKKATQAAKLISDVIKQHTHQNPTSPIHLQLDADSETVGFGVFSEIMEYTVGKHHR